MTWTNPRTWSYGELVTSALLNSHLRDNLLALYPYTTEGDIAKLNAAGALERLGVGDESQTLKSIGGDLVYSSAIGWRAHRDGSQSIGNNTTTTLTYTDVDYLNPVFDFNPGGGELTILADYPGIYLIGASGYFDGHASAGTIRQLNLDVSVATSDVHHTAVQDTDTQATWVSVTHTVIFIAGSTVKARVLQRSGASLSFYYATFWGYKLA